MVENMAELVSVVEYHADLDISLLTYNVVGLMLAGLCWLTWYLVRTQWACKG